MVMCGVYERYGRIGVGRVDGCRWGGIGDLWMKLFVFDLE